MNNAPTHAKIMMLGHYLMFGFYNRSRQVVRRCRCPGRIRAGQSLFCKTSNEHASPPELTGSLPFSPQNGDWEGGVERRRKGRREENKRRRREETNRRHSSSFLQLGLSADNGVSYAAVLVTSNHGSACTQSIERLYWLIVHQQMYLGSVIIRIWLNLDDGLYSKERRTSKH